MVSFVVSFKPMTKVLRQSGMSSEWFAEPSLPYNLYCFLTNALCLTIAFLVFCVILWVDYEPQDLAAWATMLTVNFCGLASSYFAYAHRGEIEALVRNFDLTTDLLSTFSDQYSLPEDDVFMKYCSKFTDLYSRFTVPMSCLVTAFYHSPVWINDVMNNCYRTNVAYKIYLPYPYEEPGLYEITWTLMALGFIVPAIKKGSVEMFALCILQQQVKHLASARALVRQILANPSDETNAALRKWNQLHQMMLQNCKDVVQIQAPIVIMNYLNMVTLAACILYIGTQDQRLSMAQVVAAQLYFLFALSEIFLICSLFEKVSDEMNSTGDEVYFSDWYLMKKQTVTSLRMVLMAVQKPLAPAYCCEVLRLNRRSFSNTLGSIISTYLAFLKLEEIVSKGKLY